MTLAAMTPAQPAAFEAREVRDYLRGSALGLATEREKRGERAGYHAAKAVIADVLAIVPRDGMVLASDLMRDLPKRLEAAEAEVATLRNLMGLFSLNKSLVERGLPTTFSASDADRK